MKKLVSSKLILIFSMLVLAAASMHILSSAHAEAAQQDAAQISLAVVYGGESIDAWETLDEIYLFLPSYFDRDETFLAVGNGYISLDGGEAVSKLRLGDLDDTHYTYSLAAGKESEAQQSGNLYIYQSSSVGTVYIDTQSGSMDLVDADKEYKEAGVITVCDESGGMEYSGTLKYIKSRGNATWKTEKKSYGISLGDGADLFGMGRASDWVLVSGVYDGSKLLNKICFDMADAIGLEYSLESEWVDLYINGEYRGNYLLCEKIQVADGRIEADDGASLIEVDCYMDPESGFATDDGNSFTIHYSEDLTADLISETAALVQCAEDAVLAGDLEAASEYIDWDSFVLRYLLDEFVMNFDMGITSTYFYVSGGRLYSGPVWDYDNSFGSGAYADWMDYTVVVALDMEELKSGGFTWYRTLYMNDTFMEWAAEKYEDILRPYLIWLMEEGLEAYAEKAVDSVKMDMERWDYDLYHAGHYQEYENNVRYIAWFIGQRMSFLDGLWLGEENTYVFEGTGEIHTVTFTGTNGSVSMEVADGEVIDAAPDELLGEGGYWVLEDKALLLTEYLPVLEDMTFVEADE